jgi:hypothetical protein
MAVVIMTREPVEKWNSKDFAAHYMRKLEEISGVHMVYVSRDWAIYSTHIKRFMNKLHLSNAEYKDFVDWVFSPDFLCGKTHVNFLCVVNPDVHQLYMRLLKKNSPHVVTPMTDSEEQALRGRISSSATLFSEDA